MKESKQINSPVLIAIALLFLIYLVNMFFLSAFRLGFLLANMPHFELAKTAKSMLIGLKFDGVINSFVTAIPFLIVVVASFFNINPKKFKIFVNSWFFFFFSLVFILTLADIPYYAYFHDHLNVEVFSWFAFLGDTLGMIFQDWHNYLYSAILILIIYSYVKIILLIEKKIFSAEFQPVALKERLRYIPLFLLCGGSIFCAMRGTFERYPLRVGGAYFSNDSFYNRVGVAPVFNIIESMKYSNNSSKEEIDAMNIDDAIVFVQQTLSINKESVDYNNNFPLKRTDQYAPSEAVCQNVVIILLESLCAVDLDEQFNGEALMPYLSSLRSHSIYFPQFYSTAVHTNCGITGTLFGYAPNFAHSTMSIPATRYTGLPSALKQNGYATMFFITGNPQYDRMNSFLYDNNIDRIYSLYDYPADKAVNNFGVADDYLFQFGLATLSEKSKEDTPFFATFLTVSNHPPYVIPENLQNVGDEERESMLAFTDRNVKEFLTKALQTSWGKNTIFVLLGDHGYIREPNLYDMPLTYNHIPCFIITPDQKVQQITSPCSQLDIAATVMGLLKTTFTNNTLGVNVLKDSRTYAFFVNDNQIGCVDSSYFYCYNFNSKQEFLYHLGDAENIIAANREKATDMKKYAFSMMAVNNAAVRKKWTE